MKGKRVLSLALAALMTLSLLVVPAAAVSFTDMTNHWAKDDVEYLATQGVVKGISATTFAPDQKMTACEALLFCSRATGVDAIDKEAIAEDWEDELKEILPKEMYAWAAQEMAVCLETGIISETELRALSSAGGLVKSITRETLAMYLVRAMQLAPLAQSLTSYPMSFADTTSISASLQPYVYLLNMYGIVKGNELNRFLPQNSLTRAEMATMLRRAIDFMDERGIYAELPGYTDYDWVGGTIAAVSTGSSGVTLLTLTSVVSGTRSISLPADAEIYENNMLSSADALKVGSYARVNLDRKGTAESVRLGGAVTSYTGSVTGVEQDSLTVTVNGASKRLDIDRFTEVQVGKTAGDYTLLDPQAGYTTATCYVDAMGHLDAVQLSGGTRAEEGILVKVENGTGGQRLQVSAFNGETRRYTLPAIYRDGKSSSLDKIKSGDTVVVTVRYNKVTTLETTPQSANVTGTITRVVQDAAGITFDVKLTDGSTASYTVSEGVSVTQDGTAVSLYTLKPNDAVAMVVSGGDVVSIEVDRGSGSSSQLEGTVLVPNTKDKTLMVQLTDGNVLTADVSDASFMSASGSSTSLRQLEAGDRVQLFGDYKGARFTATLVLKL